MKKLLIGLLALSACTTKTTVTPAPARTSTGAAAAVATPRAALDAFLGAIRAKDLQALGAAWGDKDGAIRDSKRISRDELEKRELVLMCYFNHDSYRVLSESQAAGGERVMSVNLVWGTLSRTTNFYLVSGGDRWYVRTADMEPVRDLCLPKK